MKTTNLKSTALLFLLFITLASCSTKKEIPLLFPVTSAQYDWVNKQLKEMTLREKCAQLVFPYADSKDISAGSKNYARLEKLVEKYGVGGFVFFGGKIKNQIKIINQLQSISKTPLLIMGDYERGPGMRLDGAVEFPPNMALGATNNPKLSYLVGRATAKLAKLVGVHQTLSPVVDVNRNNSNPIINNRSFSDDPFYISLLASAYIRGVNSERVISTAKHFPGEGSIDVDSHTILPEITKSEIELEKTDLVPFREAIDSGVRSIMIGHLRIKALDPYDNIPASLSWNVVNDFLKTLMGFKGLVVSDALNMHSITKSYSSDVAAVMAIKAGDDVVLFPKNDSLAIAGLIKAVRENQISEERIDESVRKILFAKAWSGLSSRTNLNEKRAIREFGKKDYLRLAAEISEHSITLLKNNNLIPLHKRQHYKVISIALTDYTEKSREKEKLLFNELVLNKFKKARSLIITLRNKRRKIKRALKLIKKYNLVLLPVFLNVKSFKGSIKLPAEYSLFIKKVLRLKRKTILISFGSPYIIQDFPTAKNYLCAYGSADCLQKAAFNAITGKANIEGKLPVSINNTNFIRGSGIAVRINHLLETKKSEDSLYDFSEVDSLMNNAVKDSVFPGAVLLVGRGNKIIYFKPFGRQTYSANSPAIKKNSIFDLASVSKVVGTTSAAMILYQEGKLKLDSKVIDYLPEFNNNGKGEITIRNLLLHNSGLPAWEPFYKRYKTAGEVIKAIMRSKLKFKPGEKYLYSDLGMITLQKVIEKITKTRLDKFLKKRLFKPLHMNRTMYNPPKKYFKDCVPTEIDNYWRMRLMKGRVHDETAYLLGGIAGHAGLFSTAGDIAKLLFTLINKGVYNNKQIFEPDVIQQWTARQSAQSSRALGWDTKSPNHSSAGHLFSANSFGHTGFTGTSVWVDKTRRVFVVLLTNRVYPTRKNRKIIKFRPVIHDAIIRAIDYNF